MPQIPPMRATFLLCSKVGELIFSEQLLCVGILRLYIQNVLPLNSRFLGDTPRHIPIMWEVELLSQNSVIENLEFY